MPRVTKMSVEAITLASVMKWLVGLVLAPWLWHERKRVDNLKEELSEHKAEQYTKEEVKEQIALRNKPIIDKLDMIYGELQKLRKD